MKNLLLIAILVLTSAQALACSCDFDFDESLQFKTPSVETQVTKLIRTVFNAAPGEYKLKKYNSNLFERVFGKEGDGANCWSQGPRGENIYACRQSVKATVIIRIPELDCKATVKVKRNKRKSTAKLISHTCKL